MFFKNSAIFAIPIVHLELFDRLKVTYDKLKVNADVVKLVDTPDLGSGAERYAGSSPSIRTILGLYFRWGPFLFIVN